DFDFALLTDGLRAEREQGITIDVAYRYFATDKRSFILADCPGHVQYTRNTVTGASTADVVIILVDARHGVLEQTRRHLAVAALLRVPHVVLAVNKIDLVDYDEAVFTKTAKDVNEVADQLGITDVQTIPVSALVGDNIVDRSDRTNWYDAPTLLEFLENASGRSDASGQPLRFPVQYVIRPQTDDQYRDYRGYTGTVASGTVSVGDQV
ncbi:GTP-binding protein, partial [Kribbella endophytica]